MIACDKPKINRFLMIKNFLNKPTATNSRNCEFKNYYTQTLVLGKDVIHDNSANCLLFTHFLKICKQKSSCFRLKTQKVDKRGL